jgi:hypothetical protein
MGTDVPTYMRYAVALTEPRTARQWRDPYAEASVDLSRVDWIMTANTLAPVPVALRDRLRTIHFPEPSRKHMAALTYRLLANMAIDRGLDPRWAAPPDVVELAALSACWTGDSIRRLTKLVGAVALARERLSARH